jgi:hypothetical protein
MGKVDMDNYLKWWKIWRLLDCSVVISGILTLICIASIAVRGKVCPHGSHGFNYEPGTIKTVGPLKYRWKPISKDKKNIWTVNPIEAESKKIIKYKSERHLGSVIVLLPCRPQFESGIFPAFNKQSWALSAIF